MPGCVGWKCKADASPHQTGCSTCKSSPRAAFDERLTRCTTKFGGMWQARLRRRTGAHFAMALIASCAHRLHLLEDGATDLFLVSCPDRCSGQGRTATFLLRFLRDANAMLIE